MQVPLKVAVPAAAASLAYLNARWSIVDDYNLIGSLIASQISIKLREKRDRVNGFYILEEYALARKSANREFLVYDGRSWTYKQTYDTVLKYAAMLKEKYGVKPKEIVGLDFTNCTSFIFFWFALWSLGATPAFINYNLTGKPLTHSVKVSTARLLFVDNEVRSAFTPEVLQEMGSPDFRDGKGPLEVVFYDEAMESSVLYWKPYRAPDTDRSGALIPHLAVLIYTSGTTGLPKPAIVSWSKIILGGGFVYRWMGMKTTDRFYTCMPIYHTSAAALGVGTCLGRGCTIVIGHRFSTKTFWPEVRDNKCTIIQYVGETLRYLLAAAPSPLDTQNNVRVAFGNGLRPDVWERFKSRFAISTIAEFYGATEGASATWNLSSNSHTTGAVGRNGVLAGIMMGSQVALVQLDYATEQPYRSPITGHCNSVPRGEPGELLYRLDPADVSSKFQGYFNNPGATNSKIMRDVLKKGDAWFRTGDVLRWDNEGRWFFSDRIGDTYRWKSENVSTNEVSEVLGTHPSVLEANVYGVSVPHHDGRAGCAAVLLATPPTESLLASLASHAQTNLPKYAVPMFVRVVRQVTATGNNKQQKHVLRNQGIEPGKVVGDGDELLWLRGKTYVPFAEAEWRELEGGRVRL